MRGLQTNRKANGKLSQYHVWNDIKEMGMIIYSDKKLQNPENFADQAKNLEGIYDDSKRAILRVLVKIKSPTIIKALDPNGEEIRIPLKNKTWDHLVLYESELIAPPLFTSRNKLENYQEWLGKFKMGKWIISDLDHFMMGNSLFEEIQETQKIRAEVFKGSDLDPNVNYDIRI